MRALRIAQYVLFGISAVLLGYVALLALRPSATLPGALSWFGTPASARTVAVVAVVVGSLCLVSYLVRHNRASATVPVVIVVGLLATGFLLAFATFWSCGGDAGTRFFTPLEWASALLKGGTDDRSIVLGTASRRCPTPPTSALNIARLLILGSFAVGVVGVATAAFRLQADRVRVRLARSVTAVVGADEAAVSMVTALTRQMGGQGALVLLTTTPDSAVAQDCRAKGARVMQVDFDHPETMGTPGFWRKVDRLYLLSPDPSTNLSRLPLIGDLLGTAGTGRRLPLIVRIDDPWLAMSWRAEQFGGSDMRWAADAVGKYEVTARRLLDQITAVSTITKVLVCGSSQLTLALCADMSRRQLERDYYPLDQESELPKLVIVAVDAEQYLADHEFQQRTTGFSSTSLAIGIEPREVSESVLRRLVGNAEDATAAIFVDSSTEASAVTRLAARFPGLHTYAWDVEASVAAEAVPITGRLRNYRLAIDLPTGQAHDNWERAAMLTHERFVTERRGYSTPEDLRDNPTDVSWAKLTPFYRESNRRQVRNALQIVEQLGGHTWNTWGDAPDDLTPETVKKLGPLEQLKKLGFAEDAIYAMARAEFEDWSRHLERDGWTYGPKRDYPNKKHEKLVGWDATRADEALRNAALRSLAGTLIQLRELGYRSKPKWEPYRRVGEVTARRRRFRSWSWVNDAGDTLVAERGSWEVRDDDDESWSVRDAIFRTSYRRVEGHRWEAHGVVLARRATPGETIESFEGSVTAGDDYWVVMGDQGEQWATPHFRFERRYHGPVSFQDRFEHWKDVHEES